MARWAWFATDRGGRGGASAPRVFGPDGRELLRPWRVTAPEVEQRVQQLRAQRRQPVWPRLLGALLLSVAGVAALHPVGSIPTHVAASSSARPGGGLLALRLESPAGELTAAPAAFRWRGEGAHAVDSLVLCDASYAEIARVDGIDRASWQVAGPVADLLAPGGTFHWFVESTAAGVTRRSTLETFAIR